MPLRTVLNILRIHENTGDVRLPRRGRRCRVGVIQGDIWAYLELPSSFPKHSAILLEQFVMFQATASVRAASDRFAFGQLVRDPNSLGP